MTVHAALRNALEVSRQILDFLNRLDQADPDDDDAQDVTHADRAQLNSIAHALIDAVRTLAPIFPEPDITNARRCLACGNPFIPNTASQTTCSAKCRQRLSRAARGLHQGKRGRPAKLSQTPPAGDQPEKP